MKEGVKKTFGRALTAQKMNFPFRISSVNLIISVLFGA